MVAYSKPTTYHSTYNSFLNGTSESTSARDENAMRTASCCSNTVSPIDREKQPKHVNQNNKRREKGGTQGEEKDNGRACLAEFVRLDVDLRVGIRSKLRCSTRFDKRTTSLYHTALQIPSTPATPYLLVLRFNCNEYLMPSQHQHHCRSNLLWLNYERDKHILRSTKQ